MFTQILADHPDIDIQHSIIIHNIYLFLEQHIKDQSINNRRRRWKKNVKIGTRVMYSYNLQLCVCQSSYFRTFLARAIWYLQSTGNSIYSLSLCVCVYPTKGRVSSSKPPQPPWSPMGCLNDQSINGMHML